MPSLTLIESEAARLLRRVPEAGRRVLQQALLDLCEAHWLEMRGPEPATPLAHALWAAAPARADLLADLAAAGDGRLHALVGAKTAQAFALLVMAEIERGNAEGVRLAHAPMMLFATPTAGALYAEGMAAALRGGLTGRPAHPHAPKPAVWKALACIVAQTGRSDLAAVTAVIGVLCAGPDAADAALAALRRTLADTGVDFLGIDAAQLRFTVHGEAHPPLSLRQLGEMLGEIRAAWHA